LKGLYKISYLDEGGKEENTGSVDA